eukprot:4594900-Prymnesium_polylepis.2
MSFCAVISRERAVNETLGGRETRGGDAGAPGGTRDGGRCGDGAFFTRVGVPWRVCGARWGKGGFVQISPWFLQELQSEVERESKW